MPSAIGSNGSNGFAPQQTQIALSTSFSDIQLLSNFDALELQGHVFVDVSPFYRASFKLSIVKRGADGVYEIAASDIAGDDYLGSPIMSFQISGNYLQCKMDVAGATSGYVKFNIDTPTPALVGTSSLSIEGSNIVSEIPASRIPDLDAAKIASGTLDSARLPAGQYPGADGSSAIGAGYVGEIIYGRRLSSGYTSVNVNTNYSESVILTPGVWMFHFLLAFKRSATQDRGMAATVSVDGVSSYNLGSRKTFSTGEILQAGDTAVHQSLTSTFPIVIAPDATGDVSLIVTNFNGNAASQDTAFEMFAVRIA